MAAIASHPAAEVPRLGERPGTGQQRNTPRLDLEPDARGQEHLGGVSQEAEAGDVRGARGAGVARHPGGQPVQPAHAPHRPGQHVVGGGAVLAGGRNPEVVDEVCCITTG